MNLNRLRISARVTIGVTIPLILLVIVGIWSWLASDDVYHEVKMVRDERFHLMLLAQRMGKDLLQMQYYFTEVAINKEERKDADIFSGATDYYESFLENLTRYETFYQGKNKNKVVKTVDQIRTLTNEFYELGKKMSTAFVNGEQNIGFKAKESFNETAEMIDFYLEPLLRQERDMGVFAMNNLVVEMSFLKQGLLIVMLVAVIIAT